MSKIPNSKHQTTNKSKIQIAEIKNVFEISNFGHWDLFGIWNLDIGIFDV